MSTKTYTLLVSSRQFPLKKRGDTIELAPKAVQYLEQAGVVALTVETEAQPLTLAEGVAQIDGTFVPADGIQLGPVGVPPPRRFRKNGGEG